MVGGCDRPLLHTPHRKTQVLRAPWQWELPLKSTCSGQTPIHLLQSTGLLERALPGDMAQETQQGKNQITSGDTTLAQKVYAPFTDYC